MLKAGWSGPVWNIRIVIWEIFSLLVHLIKIPLNPMRKAVYLYQLESNGSVTFLTKVTSHQAGSSNDNFGTSVFQSGNTLAVGAPRFNEDGVGDRRWCLSLSIGSKWLDHFSGSNNCQSDKHVSDYFGWSVSVSGNIIAVGSRWSDPDGVLDAGAAYLYQLENNGSDTYLTQVVAPDKYAADSFGYSVSQSGNILAVGAKCFQIRMVLTMRGAAYLYQLECNGSSTYLTKLTAPDRAANALFRMVCLTVRKYSCNRFTEF